LPVTVLSRCLQFSLKRLSVDEIATQLEKILAAEKIEHDAPSVRLLARGADGSMRDGLSLLDQAIAYGGGGVAEAEVRAMLGSIDQNAVDRLLQGLAANDARALIATVADVIDHGTDCAGLLDALLMTLHRVALAQVDPVLAGEELGETVRAHAKVLSPEDVQLYYQIGLVGRRDLALAPDPRTGVEMTLLRMLAFRPAVGEEGARPASSGAAAVAAGGGRSAAAPRPAGAEPRKPVPAMPAAAATVPDTRVPAGPWAELVERLSLVGMVRELANNTAMESQSEDEISLVLDESCAQYLNKEREAALKTALEQHFGRTLKFRIRTGRPPAETPAQQRARLGSEQQQAAVEAVNSDPNVRALREKFNARVNPDSIKPTG
jgi:DNA polymerase III subunit gamma/tau